MKKRRLKTAVSAFVLAAAAALSGCGSAKSSSAFAPQETMAGQVENEMADMEFGESSSPGEEFTSSTGGEAGASQLPAGRKLIQTVEMDVETDGFDDLLSQINQKIRGLGGYVEQSDISGSRVSYQNTPQPRYAFITARIPAGKLLSFVTAVEENGNVIAKSENTQDVTLQYSDIESRKKSLSIEQDRIWALLEKADTLETVITLESRLSEIRYELEKMESQLRLYDNQVDYSSVTLRINEVNTFTPTTSESAGQRIRNGFTKNLRGMSDLLVNLFVGFAAASPIWIPFLAIMILCLYISRKRGKGIAKKLKKDLLKGKRGDES